MRSTNDAQNTLEMIEAVCRFAPAPALSSVAELLCSFVQALQNMKENTECCNSLIETALEVSKSMNDSAKEIIDRGEKISTNLLHHIDELNDTLYDVILECYRIMARQSTLKRLWWQNRNKEAIDGLIDRMKGVQTNFQNEILGIHTSEPAATPSFTNYTHTPTPAPSFAPPPYSAKEKQSIGQINIAVPSSSNVQDIGNHDITGSEPMVRVRTSGIVVGKGAIARNIGNVTTRIIIEPQPGTSN